MSRAWRQGSSITSLCVVQVPATQRCICSFCFAVAARHYIIASYFLRGYLPGSVPFSLHVLHLHATIFFRAGHDTISHLQVHRLHSGCKVYFTRSRLSFSIRMMLLYGWWPETLQRPCIMSGALLYHIRHIRFGHRIRHRSRMSHG